MNTSQSPKMSVSTTDDKIPDWELTYYSRLAQNLIFDALISAFAQEAKAGRISRSKLAKRIGKTPEKITRIFANPTNLKIKTLGLLLRGLDAQLERPQITFFRDIEDQRSNYPVKSAPKQATTAAGDTLKPRTRFDLSTPDHELATGADTQSSSTISPTIVNWPVSVP